jgi:hypothetical protein
MIFKFSSGSAKEYDRVQDDDCSSDDSEASITNPSSSRIRSLFDPRGRGPWIIATTLLIPYTVALFVILVRAQQECQCQYQVGFDTEFGTPSYLILNWLAYLTSSWKRPFVRSYRCNKSASLALQFSIPMGQCTVVANRGKSGIQGSQVQKLTLRGTNCLRVRRPKDLVIWMA